MTADSNDPRRPAGVVVYRMRMSPKLNGGVHRSYWQGPGTRTWGAGEHHRLAACRFPNMDTARAAAIEDDAGFVRADDLHYEWVTDVEEPRPEPAAGFDQPELFPIPRAEG